MTDYPERVNPRAGRALLGKIASEAGLYVNLIAGDQRGYMPPPDYVLKATAEAITQGIGVGYFTGGELAS